MLKNLDTPHLDLLLQGRKRNVDSRDPLSPNHHLRRLRRAVEPADVDNRVQTVRHVPVASGDDKQPSCHDQSECDEASVAYATLPSSWITDRDTACFCVVHALLNWICTCRTQTLKGEIASTLPLNGRHNNKKNLRKVLLNSQFQYGGGGEQTTLRKLLNFQNFFTGEDALIR